MTENKRLIPGSYGEKRYLHSDEVFRKERNWNIHLPSEREFKDGYCIITDKDDTAYSIDELVELLNEFQKENEQLKEQNQRLSEQKHIYKQDWKHLCIDKELLDSENERLKEDNAILKHALRRIICEFDEHIAKNSEVRDLIK